MIRYDVKHACINDSDFEVWNQFKLNNWPTLMIVGPDGKIIQKLTEEGNVDIVEHVLLAALNRHARKLERKIESNEKSAENEKDGP